MPGSGWDQARLRPGSWWGQARVRLGSVWGRAEPALCSWPVLGEQEWVGHLGSIEWVAAPWLCLRTGDPQGSWGLLCHHTSEERAVRTPGPWPCLLPPPRGGHWTGGAATMRGQVVSPHSSAQARPHLRGPYPPRRLDPGLAGVSSSPGSVLGRSPTTNRTIRCPLPVPNQSGRSESEASDSVTARVTLWDAAKVSTPFPPSLHCPPVSMATPGRSCRADPSPLTGLQPTHELIGSRWGAGQPPGTQGSNASWAATLGQAGPHMCPLLPVHSPPTVSPLPV